MTIEEIRKSTEFQVFDRKRSGGRGQVSDTHYNGRMEEGILKVIG
jgi:hypothetical protein